MQEIEDEPLFCERAAGIDIGKAEVMVTIRVPGEAREGGRQQETRKFGTMRRELLALADWLRCWGVERAGMESTSDYWKPVFFLLEREGFDCLLYQASQVKALPGRPKTDQAGLGLAGQDHRAGVAGRQLRGLLVLHPRARLHPGDDAREHRPLHRPGRGAGGEDRRVVRAV